MALDWRGEGLMLLQQQLRALALPPTRPASKAGLAPGRCDSRNGTGFHHRLV